MKFTQWLKAEPISYFLEVSEADPTRKHYKATSQNLTGAHLLTVQEQVVYRPDPQDQQKSVLYIYIYIYMLFVVMDGILLFFSRTVFTQEAAVSAVGAYASVRSYVEEYCVNRFMANAERVSPSIQYIIKILTVLG